MEKKQISRFRSDVEKNLLRVPITINRGQDEWLDRLRKGMQQSGGYKLPRSYIIRALLGAAMELNIDVRGIKTEQKLRDKIREAIKKYKR